MKIEKQTLGKINHFFRHQVSSTTYTRLQNLKKSSLKLYIRVIRHLIWIGVYVGVLFFRLLEENMSVKTEAQKRLGKLYLS